jgi:hypothetical protein
VIETTLPPLAWRSLAVFRRAARWSAARPATCPSDAATGRLFDAADGSAAETRSSRHRRTHSGRSFHPAQSTRLSAGRAACGVRTHVAGRWCRATIGGAMPVLATFFSVRRGRDPFFKFFMRKLFPRQVKRYEEEFGMRFIGWFNVAYGWDFDNVIMLELPDYATIDKLEADPRSRAIGHRAGEWMFERHHSMFLRERMGPDLEYHP